jgi:hypothetical protein
MCFDCRPYFSGCGRGVEETIDDILQGRLDIEEIPKISVLSDTEGNYFALNNRRLYVYKRLRNAGFLDKGEIPNTVKVRFKNALPRELKKYSPTTCSLNCTIIQKKSSSAPDEKESAGDGDRDEDELKEDGDDHPSAAPASAATTTTLPPPAAAVPKGPPTFESLTQSLPQSAREEVKKAMKLHQQGKERQSTALVAKLLDRKLINREEHDRIIDFLSDC